MHIVAYTWFRISRKKPLLVFNRERGERAKPIFYLASFYSDGGNAANVFAMTHSTSLLPGEFIFHTGKAFCRKDNLIASFVCASALKRQRCRITKQLLLPCVKAIISKVSRGRLSWKDSIITVHRVVDERLIVTISTLSLLRALNTYLLMHITHRFLLLIRFHYSMLRRDGFEW